MAEERVKDAQAVALRKGAIPESIHEDLPKVNLSGMGGVGGVAHVLMHASCGTALHIRCSHPRAPTYL